MGNTFSQPTCKHCGGQRRLQATGRPGEYCSTKCRQAAYRLRQAAEKPPDTEQFDQALRIQLSQIAQAARSILDALDQPETPASAPLEQMVRLQVLAEHLTPHMVARTKQRGASWDRIGALLGMSKDTARKKWPVPARRSPPSPRTVLPDPPVSPPAPPAGPDSSDDGADRASPAAPPSAGPAPLPYLAGQDLATVLSSLQRASGFSLRTLASRTGLSASYLSRLMSGERFPAWKNAALLARICGADPEVLRRVWEASNARRDSQPRPASLASALRFLHLRAGSPTPWAIAVTSGNQLDQDHIAGLLEGTATGDWEDVQRLVQLLDGEPAYYLPLWEAEAAAHPTTPTEPAPQPPPAKTPADSPPPASTRVEELLTAFKDALGPTRATQPSPLRRCLAAPIPGVTHWSGR
ncbi:helix-turn-helix domain-containing protein [Streptomyces sp. TLI_185]|uniref:helix-turn-helix domain-containing protein n=1 Tax=Streptomyces sp. TLI_185 TaxID=2485151 RepID=UPI000F5005EA|nr:helix-turn-helix transcriptional regulator [Streptomyces sp. TLI_185]RPF39312.1 helix-turn-helix protein [Streptomyces sp. TLI_185]